MSDKEYYSHVSVRFGKVYYRGWEVKNGKRTRVHAKIPFAPTLYLKHNEESQFKSLFGDNLKERKTDSISSAREYYKQYKDVLAIYGYAPSRWQYEFIARSFKEELAVVKDELNVVSFDIETKVGENGPPGVPDPYDAVEEITHIAFQNHRTMKSVVLTTADVKKEDEYDYTLKVFDTEEELLEALLDYIETEDPDILTAWYCDGFDTPYIINRIRNVLGQDEANRLSPFGVIDEREVADGDDTKTMYEIVGRTIYDLKDLYTKFVLKRQESYSLDHISKIELGAGKLENPFKTFKEFYTKDPQRFLSYNFIDTQRVTEVDKKQGLIDIAVALTYLTKCTFSDVYSPVRYWECWIQNTLLKENTFVATERQHSGGGGDVIPGAFVEEPIPGFYEWEVSIDAAALYPSIMKCLNLSPETLVRMVDGVTPEAFLLGKTFRDYGVNEDCTLAANGAVFSKDKIGLVPRLVDMVLDGRKIAKKEMLDAKQMYIDTKDPQYKTLSELKNTLQGALKVSANSFFGVFLQPGFMFYDPRMGSAITLTGQFIIQHVANHSSKRFNDFFKTKDIKYNIYSDTDSIFFTFKNVVEQHWKDAPTLKIVDALDKLMENKLRPFIDEATNYIAEVQNHRVKTIFFKRENICSGGFWIGKKRYALKVYDSEGVRIPEGEYKIMGIEVVRSSTPQVVRDKLKKCIEHIIDKDLEGTRRLANELRKDFDTLPIEAIAFPRGANNLSKYSHPETIYTGRTPIAVRGALLFNHYLKKYELEETQTPIAEGDKIKFIYLREPNTIREDVIAFIDKLPEEFKLEKYIDRQKQYDKTFMAPLENIFEAVGWKLEEEASLDDFFA